MEKSLIDAIFKTILPHIFIITLFFILISDDLTLPFVILSLGFCLLFIISKNKKIKVLSLLACYCFFLISIFINANPIPVHNYFQPTNTFSFTKTYIPVLLKYYGIAVILAFISQTIYYLVLYKQNVILVEKKEVYNQMVYPPSRKKFIVIVIFLSVEALYEEIVFRAIPFWIGSLFLSEFVLIIITSIVFGIFHYNNSAWFGVIDSGAAGVVFAICYAKLGLLSSTVIHLTWNGIQMMELYIANIRMQMTREM